MAKAKRKISIAPLVLTSEPAMIGTLNRYVELKLKLAEATAAHELEVAELKTTFDSAVQDERVELAMLESSIQLYAVNHRKELFPGDKKSINCSNARIGFRDNPPSVGKRLSKDTFPAIARRLDETTWGEPYVENKLELNKEALLRDRARLTEEQLKAVGIRFEQEEIFYIEPTSEAIERSKTTTEEIRKKPAVAEFLSRS